MPQHYEDGYEVERLRILADAVESIPAAARSVIEFGCHNGSTTELLARRFERVLAIDIDAERLAAARARPGFDNVEWRQHDLNQPLPPELEGSFDVAVALELIEHLADPAAFLERVRSALRPEGLLLLSTPNLLSPEAVVGGIMAWRQGKKYDAWDPTHTKLFTSPEILGLLKRHGFAATKITGYHYATPALPVLKKKFEPALHHSSSWPLNRLGFNIIIEAVDARRAHGAFRTCA